MEYLIFLGIGLGVIIWGLRTNEEVVRLSSAIIGAIFLVWGLTMTPQPILLSAEIVAVIAIFRICLRCCECD
jgi:hypothetical protein